jgi:hypothetical protein
MIVSSPLFGAPTGIFIYLTDNNSMTYNVTATQRNVESVVTVGEKEQKTHHP